MESVEWSSQTGTEAVRSSDSLAPADGGCMDSPLRDSREGIVGDYWTHSRQPLSSLVFVAPMLLAYEAGLLSLGSTAMRSGADVWLRRFLECIGLSQYYLLPLATCSVLLAWHHVQHQQWDIRWPVVYGMWIESIVVGAGLLLLAYASHDLVGAVWQPPSAFVTAEETAYGRWAAYLGAGIYEELLFRLMLIPVLFGCCRMAGVSPGWSTVGAVIAASMVFAAAHYQLGITIGSFHFGTTVGEPFEWTSFLFRMLAGGLFSILFVYRGFGVAAGAHALYDILAAPW